jgi:hypothetical protein
VGRLSWFRFRSTLGRRWVGLVALALVVGGVGGVAMASVAAGRRTASSFSTYLRSTDASDVVMTLSQQSVARSAPSIHQMERRIAQLPGVRHVESYETLPAARLSADGAPQLDTIAQVDRNGSIDGLGFDQDRLVVVEGRMADPSRADEMVATREAARLLHLRVGDRVPWGLYTNAQVGQVGTTAHLRPVVREDETLVGLVEPTKDVVQDDVDRLPTSVLFTPALVRRLPADWAVGGPAFTYFGLQLDGGRAAIPRVEREVDALTPANAGFSGFIVSSMQTRAERAIRPMAIALHVFGVIAAAAALLIGIQLVARRLREGDEDRQTLRMVGAAPVTAATDGLVGVLAAVVAGALVAGAVAILLSPVAPIGPVRAVYPDRGFAVDWTVLVLGAAIIVVALGSVAAFLCAWRSPARLARRDESHRPPSRAVRAATMSGLPAPAVAGMRFALDPGRGRDTVPVRSTLLAAMLTVAMVVATLTFGASLRTLVSHPPLYGWNWSYVLNGNPWVPPQARSLLDHDPEVAAWTGLNLSSADIGGRSLPIIVDGTRTEPAPPILSGHGITGPRQVVLGVATLDALGKHVGDTVTGSLGTPDEGAFYVRPRPLRIVGTATLPALGQPIANQDHTTMGVGALVSHDFFPDALRKALSGPDPTLSGPGLVLVRLRPGVSTAAGLADMHRIAAAGNRAMAAVAHNAGVGDVVAVQSVERPAEIVNYRDLGTTPAVLDGGLAAGAIVALVLTLAASVRRRRRELALLKTFGFTRRQLASTVAWQATVAACAGVVVGMPLGVMLGRWLWNRFAHTIYAVPRPTVPALGLVLVAVVTLLLANLVAMLPGRTAARTGAPALVE